MLKKAALAGCILIGILVLVLLIGFGEEIYRCEILNIPNCD